MESREEGGRVRVGRVREARNSFNGIISVPPSTLWLKPWDLNQLKGKLKRCLRTILSAGIFPPVFYYDGEGGVKKKREFSLGLLWSFKVGRNTGERKRRRETDTNLVSFLFFTCINNSTGSDVRNEQLGAQTATNRNKECGKDGAKGH